MRICNSYLQRIPTATSLSKSNFTGWFLALATFLLLPAFGIGFAQQPENEGPFLPDPIRMFSTVPTNGDVNPYGVAFVPPNFQTGSGSLNPGDVLVSNFNNNQNLQGTGTTIVHFTKSGPPTTFFQGNAPLGLSTALGLLQAGFVVVGNSPTLDGTFATAESGSLLVINNRGQLVQTITNSAIQGPWDMTLIDGGTTATAYISNALTGTVVRMNFTVSSSGLTLQSTTPIASGYVHRGDPVTLFVAPTGLVYDSVHDALYVASSGDNAVFSVPNASSRQTDAGTGKIIYQDNVHLHGALAMTLAPNGHLLVSNSDGINGDPNQPSEIVEFTTTGKFVKQLSVDPNQGGSFGLAVNTIGGTAVLAAVDDNTSSLVVWVVNVQ